MLEAKVVHNHEAELNRAVREYNWALEQAAQYDPAIHPRMNKGWKMAARQCVKEIRAIAYRMEKETK